MTIPFEKGDSVFGYGRDSGGEQQDLSIEQQEAALRKFCDEHQLILSHFFKDVARKGSSLVGRDELQALMREFRHGCDERGVIVWKYSRFARSIDNAQYFRAEIRTRGYIFFSITDHVPDGPMGRIVEAAIDFSDEQYLINLSVDIKRGVNDLVRIYGCVPGKAPVGILREPVKIGNHRDGSEHIAHRWTPDPSLSSHIRLAFEMRASRRSLFDIQKETQLFHSINSWRTFFSNPIYTGTLQYGDQHIENYCMPIVPRELWEAVQQVQNNYQHRRHLSSIKDHPRRSSSRYILSGLAFCASCDSPLFGHSNNQRGDRRPVDSYHCTRHYRNRDCPAKRIPKADLESLVIRTFRDYILTPKAMLAAYEANLQSQSSRLQEQENQRNDLTSQLRTIKHQLTNIADAIAQNGPSPTLNERLSQLEAHKKEIETKISSLDSHSIKPVSKLSEAEIKQRIGQLPELFPTLDLANQRIILRTYIDRVSIAREGKKIKGIIYYFYPPPAFIPKADAPGQEVSVPILQSSPGAPRSNNQ